MKDAYGREIDYMRISITDRCNLRCKYCMPDAVPWIPMEEILTYEEIELICREAVSLGICKFKITGGEPLVRRGCPSLVQKLRGIPGVKQVTMTTNGVLLEEYLQELLDAGLDAVNISLDTLDAERYEQITGFPRLENVMSSIQAAADSRLRVKVNVVLQKGVNEDEWQDLLKLAQFYRLDVRFIEMMPIGFGKAYTMVSNQDLLGQIRAAYPGVRPDTGEHGNGPAVYYRISGFAGSVGLISAVHGKFCAGCNRIRMTSTGELKPCLCYEDTVSVREAARENCPEQIRCKLEQAILGKPGQHCFEQKQAVTEHRRMAQIGG